MMVELAERMGTSDIYGLLNPNLFNAKESQELMEQLLTKRLTDADKKLYFIPYWS